MAPIRLAGSPMHRHIQPISRRRLPTRVVALIAFDGLQALDLVGPMEVFAKAVLHAPESGAAPFRYEVVVASASGGLVGSNAGLQLANTVALDQLPRGLDTIVVAGGSVDRLATSREGRTLVAWLARQGSRARRIASVCTGAFVLGAAGLLDGRRVTTHWANCARLQALHPSAQVVPDAIYVADGPVYTSAGVTAGIDLALALVEQDFGPDVALAIARDLVLYLRRPGGQSQFSANLAAQAHASERFRGLLAWIADHPEEILDVPTLADRAAMSERNFARLFKAQTGLTPAAYVELVRVDRAKMLLESSDWPLARIAERSGLGNPATLIRAFRRRLRITPDQYRLRFQFQARTPGAA